MTGIAARFGRSGTAITALVLGAMAVIVVSAQQATRPQFRAGVAVTRLEVTVLDEKTRAPITGLTAKDFVVKVNGREQPIVSLAEVSVPGAANMTAPGIVEAAHDVASNQLVSPRLFVIIMNDALGGRDPFYANTGRAIAHRIIDLLGPDDLASVVFVRDNGQAQDFVQDRVLLRNAVDEYRPASLAPGVARDMATSVLLRTLEFLRPMSDYRRAVVFVTPSALSLIHDTKPGQDVNTWQLDDYLRHHQTLDELHDIGPAALSSGGQLAPIPVYTFSALGLPAPTSKDIRGILAGVMAGEPLEQWFDQHVDTLRSISDFTGGRATVATNAPAEGVPAMFNELSSYYALAYEATDPPDGRIRRLDVQVTRPNAEVLTSRQVRMSAAAGGTSPRVPPSASGTGLRTALESPLPLGGLPLRLSVIPLAAKGAREQTIAMTLGLPPVKGAERFNVRVLAYDGEGRKQFLDTSRRVDLAKATDEEGSEVLIRSQLRPGRYNIRIAVERASDAVTGTVDATVEVPDFAGERLSLSGVAIGQGDGHRISGRQEIDGLLPFAPTAVRTFDAHDRVGALLRVHQGSKQPVAVTMTTSISDALGAVVLTRSNAIPPNTFASGEAEHRFELPLTTLAPGLYLLRFVASAGATNVQREVRFFIR